MLTETGVDFTALKRVIELDDEISELNAKVNQLKAERAQHEELLTEQYAMHGLRNMSIDGRSLYLHTEKFANAKPECKQEIVEWARNSGLADMVAVNASSFKSWCREHIQEHGELPPELTDKVNFFEKVSLRNRKAS